ncbi:OmpW family outer membrane protein [Brumicola nitratireducens]|uniref:Outer membrane protein OmpW n=1 Tax=Glaciecola nitratireducens (strain JCM 12485 / KCTC 12276 / FR1064) TaxID=1085623 RepID=G4QE77_GLANF|nr:OmpW family outer membrane protein [Glaciecola nitratireducens]AEP31351.1 outer membrane protein OmpW [Glaciecola nitratireducens FR1064]
MKKLGVVSVALTTLFASQTTVAFEKGDILVRAGLATVSPNESSSNIIVGSDLGVNVGVDNNTQLGLNFAYFFTNNMNIEVLAATPFKHDVNFGVPDPLGTGNQLAEVTHLPPTVSVNYYFKTGDSSFKPYAGVGVNYTLFFDEEFTSQNSAIGLQDLSLDNSFGLAAQLGVDYLVDENWFVNGSVRYIDIDTEASFKLNGAEGRIDSIEIDPWVYTISLGYRF